MRRELGYFYILTNKTHRVLYSGSCSNLIKRINQHKRGYLEGFTKKYKVNKLVYFKRFDKLNDAKNRERQVKGWRREKKIALIENINKKWEDLYSYFHTDPSLANARSG